jgi:transposase
MDDLAAHEQPRVRDLIEARGCEGPFLPAYRPDFNPIELALSKIKAFVRQQKARSRAALDEAIAAALETMTLQDVIGRFKHAGYCPYGV